MNIVSLNQELKRIELSNTLALTMRLSLIILIIFLRNREMKLFSVHSI